MTGLSLISGYGASKDGTHHRRRHDEGGVTFEPVEESINNRIGDACRDKYHSNPSHSPMSTRSRRDNQD